MLGVVWSVVYIVQLGMLVAKKTTDNPWVLLDAFVVSWILIFTDSLRILIPLLAKHVTIV